MTEAIDIVEETISMRDGEKDGTYLLEDLERLYRRQPDALKEAIADVYRSWIRNGDPIRGIWAIDLLGRLGIPKDLSLLEETLNEIREGRSNLPRYYEEDLIIAIEEHRNAR